MSGKPRSHKPNRGGRPNNQKVIKEQRDEIQRLRTLIAYRQHSHQTWQLIDSMLRTFEELEDLATPIQAATLKDGGHSAEAPVLPGVEMTDYGLKHAGSYAEYINGWLTRRLRWAVKVANQKIANEAEDPAPHPERPKNRWSFDYKTSEGSNGENSTVTRVLNP